MVKIDILKFRNDCRHPEQPAFRPAAHLRRTRVSPGAKPRRRGNPLRSRWRLCRLTDAAYPLRVLAPRILISEGWSRPLGGGTQKERTSYRKSFLFGGAGGIRTLGRLMAVTRFPVVPVMTTSILLPISCRWAVSRASPRLASTAGIIISAFYQEVKRNFPFPPNFRKGGAGP